MKFSYCYKTSDGTRLTGVEYAKSKDEVFARLRQRGIRPIKVEHAGWIYCHRHVMLSAGFALLVAVIGILGYRLTTTPAISLEQNQRSGFRSNDIIINGVTYAGKLPRHQIAGLSKGDIARAFSSPLERYLAMFAQPGVTVHVREGKGTSLTDDEALEAAEDGVAIDAADTAAVRELKRVVAGLKEEVCLLLSAGKEFREVREWLEGRQRMECEYRAQILQGGGTKEEKNERLRTIGLAEQY